MAIFLEPTYYSDSSTIWLLTSTLVIATIIFYTAAVAIYRIYLHPLSHIPGPRLAAATHLYIFYHNWYRSGKLYLQTEKLHAKYGPVVRISPTELHLSDPTNYDKIFHIGTRYTKPAAFYAAFSSGPNTLFGTPSNEIHRTKRAAIAPFLARKSVLESESLIQSKVKWLENRIRYRLRSSGKINLHYAFRALSVDVATEYVFGGDGEGCWDLLKREDFGKSLFLLERRMMPIGWVFQQFPVVRAVVMGVPGWVLGWVSGPLEGLMMFREVASEEVAMQDGDNDGGKQQLKTRQTMFHQLLRPGGAIKGYDVPTVENLENEAYDLVGAASGTTGNALTITAYHVVANPEIYRTLKAELESAFPNPNSEMIYTKLEKLPYLTAVIKEGLRLSYGVIGRLPRVVPESGAEFNDYKVPAGALVGMSSWMMHRNEELFPEPDKFDPSRWLDGTTSNKSLDRYFVPFSKGPRQCLGMSLAYCELYIMLGRLFLHFDDLTIEKKSLEDLAYDDFFNIYHRPGKDMFCFQSRGMELVTSDG
ncbi:hypothetical protein AJ79_00908 [Helicocarpus griseus UAMH5409]|uniref:Benzoate 4-monooxygenase cytochrome P450 n=1 Tax=Helicocarpus griseus UAMH5409 TaxID=1447875 RepID=A0A2B7YAZ0_9EURO|nr:hypothetical protein AJ79_00908 [Helicocarpus griseus UAMH5409]